MLDHSKIVTERESELGFLMHTLPSTEDVMEWNGRFDQICAIQINDSSFVMKFNDDDGPNYCNFTWGVLRGRSVKPLWIPSTKGSSNPEMAIHEAKLEFLEILEIDPHPIPTQGADSK